MSLSNLIEEIEQRCAQRFHEQRTIKTYYEYLRDFLQDPWPHLRTAAHYCKDMFEFFGHEQVQRVGIRDRRWKLFDLEFDRPFDALVGQERVQNAIYRHLVQFARRGRADKMLLLHGPNGSSKTTTVDIIARGLEYYSHQPQGALYQFCWLFPERADRGTDRIGFEHEAGTLPESYARLEAKDLSALIPCELRDPPLFLIPVAERRPFIEEALARLPGPAPEDQNIQYFLEGDLSPKNRRIYDALLASAQGNWRQVVRHIQVARYTISRRYRRATVSIEPQGNIDAGTRPLNYEPTIHLPPVLQSLPLYEAVGDLVDANHGIVEYSDFLKRPIEAYKYLLTTIERGTIQLPSTMAYLELVFFATANEKQLSLFKRSSDFSSFKGRMELIQVPYLLMYSKEADLYERHIGLYSRGRHVTPHTALVAALWAVLTRLRRPAPKNYPPELAPIVARLTPFEKCRLYDHGDVPLSLTDAERKLLVSAVRQLRDEHNETEIEFEGLPGAEYEGRRGASPREMMGVLASAAENRAYTCLTPMAVFDELDRLVKDPSVYEFLRVPVDNGYSDAERFIEEVKQEYRALVETEVYSSIGLVDQKEYERIFERYFHHVKAFDLGEKLYVPARGEYEEASEDLMGRIEGLLDMREPLEIFRSNLMMKIAAFSLDHPDEPIRYQELFPRIYKSIQQSFYGERERTLTVVEQNILRYGTDEFRLLSREDQEQVKRALERMTTEYGYCQSCAKDVIAYVLRHR